MATYTCLFDANDIQQQDTITAGGTFATAETVSVTIGGVTITVTLGTPVATTDVVAAMAAAINGDAIVDDETRNTTGNLHGEFSMITASVSGSVLTLKADRNAAGDSAPFTTAVAEASTSGTWVLAAAAVASAGREDLSTALNWSGGSVPTAVDKAILADSNVGAKYGLDALPLVTIVIERSYTGQVGLPPINRDDPALPYSEYRKTALDAHESIEIGKGAVGDGSSFINVDGGTLLATIHIYHSARSGDPSRLAVQIEDWIATCDVIIFGSCEVGFATWEGASYTSFDSVLISGNGSPVVKFGPSVSISNSFLMHGGDVSGAIDVQLEQHGGKFTLHYDGQLDTNTKIHGGTCFMNGVLNNDIELAGNAILDCTNSVTTDAASTKVINVLSPKVSIRDPGGRLGTLGYKIDCHGFDVSEMKELTIGKSRRLTVGAAV